MIPVTKSLAEYLIDNHGLMSGGSNQYYAHNAVRLMAEGEIEPDDLVLDQAYPKGHFSTCA